MPERTCSIDGCDRPRHARGWCAAHYQRFRTTGSVELQPEPKRPCAGEDCDALVGTYRNTSGFCKRCNRRRHYEANREHELAGMARWREENREYDRQRWREFYSKNRETLLAVRKAAYYADHEAALARAAEWRKNNPGRGDLWRKKNPEKWALRNRENQRRRRSKDGKPVDYKAILAEYGMRCHICQGEITNLDDLHFDHVVPLARGGAHSAENIKPSHEKCNLRKGTKLLSELN